MTQAVSPESVFKGNLDWHGQLNRATGDPSQFALFLAMHLQPGGEAARFAPDPAPQQPASLLANYYRRAPHTASAGIDAVNRYSQLVASGDTASLMLWRAMHPDPLHSHDNPGHLTPEVVANCSYATQRRLQHTLATAAVPTDPSLLDDIVKSSSALLA